MDEELVNIPSTKRGRTTLNNILSAAAQCFYEKGYHATTINDITNLAGVALGTFYIYFESKYNLYKFLLRHCNHTIRRNMAESVKHCKTRREAEQEGMRAWLEFAMKNQYMYRITWESIYVDYNLFEDYYVSFQEAYQKGLEKAKRDGEIQDDIDTEVLAYIFMGIANFLGLNWCLFKKDASRINYVVEQFMKVMDGKVFTSNESSSDAKNEDESSGGNQKWRFEVKLDEDWEGNFFDR